ncbi:MAG: ABC transporter permease [Propionibacteriaceae bacterium]|jgi:hypothetical protein|nr:ABC transporter permease [Propionibacteriaceae bacterium]
MGRFLHSLHGSAVGLWTLYKRETGRIFTRWISSKPGESSTKRRFRGRMALLMRIGSMIAFPFVGAVLSRVIVGDSIGADAEDMFMAMLILITVVGFGACGLTTSSIFDDWPLLGRESLWGVSATEHILSKFLAAAGPSIGMGVLAAFLFAWDLNVEHGTVLPHFFIFCLVLFPLYTLSCTAMGLMVSSIVRGTASTIYVLMGVLSSLVLLSDVSFNLEHRFSEGPSRAILWISYLLPGRYIGGAWAANMKIEEFYENGWGLLLDNDRGWTWTPVAENIYLSFVCLVIVTIGFLVLAIRSVRGRAWKIVLHQ